MPRKAKYAVLKAGPEYQKYLEGQRAYKRVWYEKNKEVAKERTRLWRLNNPERVKAMSASWRARLDGEHAKAAPFAVILSSSELPSTTATKPKRSEGCFVRTAIRASACLGTILNAFALPRITSRQRASKPRRPPKCPPPE